MEIGKTTDPRQFMLHMALAQAWCRWIGQNGTEKQAVKVMHRLSAETLQRMLNARGVVVLGA